MSRLVRLSEVRAREMDAILAHERSAWARELDWDYSATAALIARSIDAGAFSGFALHDGSQVVAYAYYLADAEKSLLGSVHALPEAEEELAAAQLVERCLDHLIREVATRRLESQFIFFGGDDPAPVFARWGVARHQRQFLSGSIEGLLQRIGLRGNTLIRPYRNSDLKAAANIIYKSFLGSADAEMSDCYASAEGCAGFVEVILARTGCGTIEPKANFIALEMGQPVGVVFASRLSPGVGHIVQISVVPHSQGRGIGRDLMRAAAESLLARGYHRLSLSVSIANRDSRRWYLSLGFEPRKDFSAFVWNRPSECG